MKYYEIIKETLMKKELGKGYSSRNLALMRNYYIKFKNLQTVSANMSWSTAQTLKYLLELMKRCKRRS